MPGTVELVRAQGVEVVSSAELIQEFEACLNDAQFATHLEAGRRVDKVCAEAFRFIGEKLAGGVERVDGPGLDSASNSAMAGMVTDSGPIVGVNAHAGDPHYEPTPETSSPIRPGDFVLIDMWAKLDQAGCGLSTTSPGPASAATRRIACAKSSKSFGTPGIAPSRRSPTR